MKIVVLISANAEWREVKEILHPAIVDSTPLGDTFSVQLDTGTPSTGTRDAEARYFHGGWGKISASASTQYVIDRWRPDLLVNLGTCGGFEGEIARGEVILANQTAVYDIIEQMDVDLPFLAFYVTEIDLSWLD